MKNDPFDLTIFWVFERCSFLIWLLILLVLYVYFNWGKSFADRIWVKIKNGLLDSKTFKLNVEILKLLLIFILTCVCLCLHQFAAKASSVWNSSDSWEQINDVVLKTVLFSAKSLHRYFRMKHLAFLSSYFILFTH